MLRARHVQAFKRAIEPSSVNHAVSNYAQQLISAILCQHIVDHDVVHQACSSCKKLTLGPFKQAVSIMLPPIVPSRSNWLFSFSRASNKEASCLGPHPGPLMLCCPDLYTLYRLSRQLSTWSLFTTGREKIWVPSFLHQ